MATYQDPFGIGTGIGSYYQGALAQDPRMAAINRNISGQVAPDVRNQLAQAAAERGIGIGSYGAGNDQSAYLKALGLTSMDLTNKGIGQYGDVYDAVPQLRPGELFVNPTDEAKMLMDRELQAEKLKSDRAMLSDRLSFEASEGASNRGQELNFFNANRSDAASNRSKTNSILDGIIARYSPGREGEGAGNTGWQSGTLGTGKGYGSLTSSGVEGPWLDESAWSDPYGSTDVYDAGSEDFMWGLDEW